jgi:phosphoribosylformylglycinamidine synthase
MMKVAVVVFPGSNADWDALHVARDVLGADARYVFHKETELGAVDAVIVPGGFAHGDYLRCGAIARFSPIADAIRAFAEKGGPILGICNGFQVLTEMHLLPGALVRNAHLRFECRDVWLRVESGGPWTGAMEPGRVIRLPVAHGEGRYLCDAATLDRIEGERLVAFRYVGPDGERDPRGGPNGSVRDIAGVYNERRNVMGLMPHPERASEAILGNDDGRWIFESLRRHLEDSPGFRSPTDRGDPRRAA